MRVARDSLRLATGGDKPVSCARFPWLFMKAQAHFHKECTMSQSTFSIHEEVTSLIDSAAVLDRQLAQLGGLAELLGSSTENLNGQARPGIAAILERIRADLAGNMEDVQASADRILLELRKGGPA
jgi:hypothetical protein